MQQLFLFFARYHAFFLFFVLESFGLYLYFSTRQTPQKAAFLSSANLMVGGLYEYTHKLTRYWNLSAVNDSLAKENARLKMLLPSSQYSNLVETNTIHDTTLMQQYTYTAALVVNNSINRSNNFITINRGWKHGVRPNAGLVSGTGEGIVGVVCKVSNHYSVALSILHKDTRISAKLKRNQFFGVLTWDGNTTTHMDLDAVPKHATIKRGDTVITSGYSSIFPEGIMIGTVDTSYIEPGSNFYTAHVRLAVDIGNIQYVYVVDDIFAEEQNKLEREVQNER